MNSAAIDGVASIFLRVGAENVRSVESVVAIMLLDQVARVHVTDATAKYWWSNLKSQQSAIEYGDDTDAWSRALELLLENMTGHEVLVAITDDEDGPWPVIAVKKDCLTNLLKDLPFFEYFVFDVNCNCVIFDTHHNVLIVSRP